MNALLARPYNSVLPTLYATLSCTLRYVILHITLRYLAHKGGLDWL